MSSRAINLSGTGVLASAGVLAIGALGAVLYVKRQAIADALNPTKDSNLASQAADGVVTAITGGAENGGESSLGGVAARVREWITGTDRKIEAMKKVTPASSSSSGEPTAADLSTFYGL